jgi:transcriptional regulator with XRE-family HTH domain
MTGSPTSEEIAGNVRAEVARVQLRQADIALTLGLDQRAVSRRLLGRVEWSASELTKLARLLEVPVSRLLGEQEISTVAPGQASA